MLVLRLLVMVLSIICLMDGHAEVSSSTTGIRNGGESPLKRENIPEVKIEDRKKKKPKKPQKKGKKGKKGNKKKPPKTVMTTTTSSPTTTMPTTISTSKPTTTPILITATPTTTASTSDPTPTPPTTTEPPSSCAPPSTTAAMNSTSTTTTKSTSPGPSDTCYDAKDKGTSSYRGTQSTTQSGRTCQKWTEQTPHKHDRTSENFPDGGLGDHNYCRRPVENGLASSPWCFTTDKKKRWEHCGIPFCQTCVAINKKPCLFPFKYGGTVYNECANEKDKYYWCATSFKSDGISYSGWEKCPEDDSCPLEGKTTIPPTSSPTTPSGCPSPPPPPSSASSTFVVKDGDKFFECKLTFTYTAETGFKIESDLTSSCSPTSSTNTFYNNQDEHAFEVTTDSGTKVVDCKVNIIVQDEESGIGLATKTMKKYIKCSVDESECVTISGEHFPSSCILPFIHEGRIYQACTDKGDKDPDKLWCATAVDENEEMTKWGYCSGACGYCGGKDVTDQDTRSVAECGYDCLIVPFTGMEPKTNGINWRLLSAPGVSYYKDEMTDWNMLPDSQFQFLQGQPGVFLNCTDGFNHFPCHETIYINCTGDYRFSVYAAEIKDDKTATIGKFIKNEVKNVHVGCGPCPMGFIYKVGDEVSTYLTSAGKFNGVPDIAACRDLCNDRACPTFVYSLEDKYCELHSVRVEKPSNQVFKDYRLCTREEENSCDTEDKCCETLTLSASGGTAEHQGHRLGTYKMDGESNDKPVYKQQGGSNALHYYKEGNQYRWSFASSVSSGGGLSSKLGDASDCPSDVKIWQYYLPGTTNDWFEDSTVEVKCEEESTCGKTRGEWTLKCPDGYEPAGDGAPSLYTLEDWTSPKYPSEECAKKCFKDDKCRAVQYSKECGKCKLLTDKEHATDGTSTKENKYCLKPDGEYVSLYEAPGCGEASISNSPECEFAAKSLGYDGNVEDIEEEGYPPGCSVALADETRTYFNQVSNGKTGKQNFESICHKGTDGPCTTSKTRTVENCPEDYIEMMSIFRITNDDHTTSHELKSEEVGGSLIPRSPSKVENIEACKEKCDPHANCKSFVYTECKWCYILNHEHLVDDTDPKDTVPNFDFGLYTAEHKICQKRYVGAIGQWDLTYENGPNSWLKITHDGETISGTEFSGKIYNSAVYENEFYVEVEDKGDKVREYYKLIKDGQSKQTQLQVKRYVSGGIIITAVGKRPSADHDLVRKYVNSFVAYAKSNVFFEEYTKLNNQRVKEFSVKDDYVEFLLAFRTAGPTRGVTIRKQPYPNDIAARADHLIPLAELRTNLNNYLRNIKENEDYIEKFKVIMMEFLLKNNQLFRTYITRTQQLPTEIPSRVVTRTYSVLWVLLWNPNNFMFMPYTKKIQDMVERPNVEDNFDVELFKGLKTGAKKSLLYQAYITLKKYRYYTSFFSENNENDSLKEIIADIKVRQQQTNLPTPEQKRLQRLLKRYETKQKAFQDILNWLDSNKHTDEGMVYSDMKTDTELTKNVEHGFITFLEIFTEMTELETTCGDSFFGNPTITLTMGEDEKYHIQVTEKSELLVGFGQAIAKGKIYFNTNYIRRINMDEHCLDMSVENNIVKVYGHKQCLEEYMDTINNV